ncbi:MAG: outer membrane beta-barrel protein [Bacteroidales bacterium]
MVDRGTNIDLIFRNGLHDLEIAPPGDLWNSISPAIKTPARAFSYYRIAAAVLAIVSLGSIPFMISGILSGGFNTPAITMNQETYPAGVLYIPVKHEQSPVQNISIARAVEPRLTAAEPVRNTVISPEILAYSDFRKEIDGNFNLDVRRQSDFVKATVPATLPEIAELDLDAYSGSRQPEKSRFSVSAMVTPSYYSNQAIGRKDAASDIVAAEKPVVSYTGGMAINIDVSKRLTVQAGIAYSSMGQKITGISAYSGFSTISNSKGGSEFSVLTSSGTIRSDNRDIFLFETNTNRVASQYTTDMFDPVKADLAYVGSTINQDFKYLEVPVLVKYKFIDRKVDFRLIGGLSYNVLVGNRAYVENNGKKVIIGDTDGLSPVTFSSAVGMGMEYNLSGHFSLNLEPTFRYYITPLGGIVGSSVHPYSFGMLSGILYKF